MLSLPEKRATEINLFWGYIIALVPNVVPQPAPSASHRHVSEIQISHVLPQRYHIRNAEGGAHHPVLTSPV